jgi:hypothetical protein
MYVTQRWNERSSENPKWRLLTVRRITGTCRFKYLEEMKLRTPGGARNAAVCDCYCIANQYAYWPRRCTSVIPCCHPLQFV